MKNPLHRSKLYFSGKKFVKFLLPKRKCCNRCNGIFWPLIGELHYLECHLSITWRTYIYVVPLKALVCACLMQSSHWTKSLYVFKELAWSIFLASTHNQKHGATWQLCSLEYKDKKGRGWLMGSLLACIGCKICFESWTMVGYEHAAQISIHGATEPKLRLLGYIFR
jgi:hypothetical protein